MKLNSPLHKETSLLLSLFFSLSLVFSLLSFITLYDAREFSNERGRVERRAQFHKCRSRQMFTEAMSAYLNWITQAGVSFIFFTYCYLSYRYFSRVHIHTHIHL